MSAASLRHLRIGLLRDGRILSERILPPSAEVSLGADVGNTIVVPDGPDHQRLFSWTQKAGWALHPEGLKGRLSTAGGPTSIRQIAASMPPTGVDRRIALGNTDRGRLRVGAYVVLFQLVAPPARAIRSLDAMDFRPRMLDDDDPVFLGMLGIWSALAAVLTLWIWQHPADVDIATLSHDADRLLTYNAPPVLVPDPPPESEPLEVPEAAPEPTPEQPPEEVEVADADGPAPEESDAALRQRLLSNPLVIGTKYSNAMAGLPVLEDDSYSAVLDALDEQAGSLSAEFGSASRGGTGGGPAEIDGLGSVVGSIDRIGVKGIDPVTAPTITAPPPTEVDPDLDHRDRDTIRRVIQARVGQLQYCYERIAKSQAGRVGGRLEVAFTISDGRVATTWIAMNGTGSADLAACVEKKVQNWRFGGVASADVEWPFVFSSKE